MWCVLDLFRCLLCCEDDEPRTKYPPSYSYHSETQSRVQRAPLLSGHNAPTRYEFSGTTPSTTSFTCPRNQFYTQTTSMKQEKSKVSSPSTLKPDSSFRKLLSNNYCLEGQKAAQVRYDHNALTSYDFSCKFTSESQSYTQFIPTKPEKSKEAIQKPNVLSPSILKLNSSSPKLPKQTISTKTKKSSETVQKPNVFNLSTLQLESSSPKPRQYSSKPTLSHQPFNQSHLLQNPVSTPVSLLCRAPCSPTMDQKKTNHVGVVEGTTPLIYKVPEDVEALIKKDIMPSVLKKPLSPSTYKDFFHTLLYSEDWYIEKWNGFEMKDVTLELEDTALHRKNSEDKNLKRPYLKEKDVKVFVGFEMDSVPHRRPFLLSRDFASVRPSGTSGEPFKGIIFGVRRSRVLVEFGINFRSQHYQDCKYDVQFSFNRICLKRAHQAIDSVSDNFFKNFLFPTSYGSSQIRMFPSQSSYTDRKLDTKQIVAVRQICTRHGPPPCLIEGPLCLTDTKKLSRTGIVIREVILRTYKTNSDARILICAPTNSTCDELVKSLQEEIPESSMFRANAAFREKDEVLLDILPSCRISGECFSCPSIEELKNFKVVSSTYISCFRLRKKGLVAGHFSHLLMLDASSTTEPEALVALAHFAHESTNVVVAGAQGNSTRWVRSPMARGEGLLRRSYFERLCESKLKKDVCHL